jgi:hypothetical protein
MSWGKGLCRGQLSFLYEREATATGKERQMAKIPVPVGGLRFASKGDASDHFRAILYRYAIGERIPEPDATELEWLLERHSEATEKIGAGVDYFSVRAALYGTRCFEVVRTDGSKTDFSFRNCVDGRAPGAQAQVFDALRAAVTGDILDKKRAWFTANADAEGKVTCALTGTRVSFEESHPIMPRRARSVRSPRRSCGPGASRPICRW